VAPLQAWLAKTLDRRVVIEGDAGSKAGVRIGLLGRIRVEAPKIEVGAPAWSGSPRFLSAQDVKLGLRYIDLWRAWRTGALNVADLEAIDLDVVLERLGDGRASWQFGRGAVPDSGAKPTVLPSFGQLRVGSGHVVYSDAILPANIDARFALSDGSGPAAGAAASDAASSGDEGMVVHAGRAAGSASAVPRAVSLASGESGLVLAAVGRYRQFPLRIDLRTAGVLGLFRDGDGAQAQPLKLLATIGRTDLAFEGITKDPLHLRALTGRFTIAGSSLAVVGDLLGVTLPTTPAFKMNGKLAKDGAVWNAVFDTAAIGSSRLSGAFTYDARPKVPLLAGRIGGSRLVLADLGPAVGTPNEGDAPSAHGDRVIPDKHFDLPSLRAMDANVLVEIAMFDPGTSLIEPLRPVRGQILLADGVLTIADFEGQTAGGRLVGYLQLDGRDGQALWTADMRALGVDMAQWLRLKRKANAPPYLSGKIDALVKVKGQGRSTAEILGSLDGDIRAHLRHAAVSHLAIELAGVDVAQALGVFIKGDDALPILCNVVELGVVKGVVTPKVFVVNTSDSTVWIDGTVSLKTEGLDLRAVVSPKDFSPLALRTPIHLRGQLGSPAVSLETGKLAGKAAVGLLLALLNPLAAIVPFVDPGDATAAREQDAVCANLVKTSGVIQRAQVTPGLLHVPPAASAPGARMPS
jgi:uncharacterized protein involved in outer membrane biogenesis